MVKDLKEKIKQKIKEFKDNKKREFGEKRAKGVERPSKGPQKDRGKKPQTEDRRHAERKKKVVTVGPRGGQSVASRIGTKEYIKHSKIKKSEEIKGLIEDLIKSEESIEAFIEKFKKFKDE
jgi:hypothetical protein